MFAPLLVLLEPPNPIILLPRRTLHSHLKMANYPPKAVTVQVGSADGSCMVALVAFGNQIVLVVGTLFVVVGI